MLDITRNLLDVSAIMDMMPQQKRMGLKLYNALGAFRLIYSEMPIQLAMSFMFIANNEGCSVTDVKKALDLSQSAASRLVAALTEWSNLKRPGYGLVVSKADPMEMRRKILRLTPKGNQFFNTLDTIMEG